jgi:phosphoesterase RecJ-like protein
MKIENIQELQSLLESPKQVVIVPHTNPDGDAIGSSIGFMHFLRQNKHEVQVISPNQYPNFLKWVPGSSSLSIYEENPIIANEKIAQADLIFTLDFNSLSRIGEMGAEVAASQALKIIIDHHQEPDDFAYLTFSYPSLGSTCELVYHIIEGLGSKDIINANIATALYLGILTDTGSFRFPSVTPTTHRVVASLIENGANPSEINRLVNDTANLGRLQLLGIALNNLQYDDSLRTATITLSHEELKKCNFQKGDSEGIVNYGLSISNCVLAVLMIEHPTDGFVKMSFRSKGHFSVSEFAREHFSGGGHTNAAGGKSDLSLQETHKLLLKKLNQCQQNLQKA